MIVNMSIYEAIILVGLPGMGKTSIGKKIIKEHANNKKFNALDKDLDLSAEVFDKLFQAHKQFEFINSFFALYIKYTVHIHMYHRMRRWYSERCARNAQLTMPCHRYLISMWHYLYGHLWHSIVNYAFPEHLSEYHPWNSIQKVVSAQRNLCYRAIGT